MLKIDRIELADYFTPKEITAEIFRQCKGLSFPIPLREIAKQCGIKNFISFDISTRPEGVLYADTNKDDAVVLYRKHPQNPGRERYSIAHELGHYLLPHHTMTKINGPEHSQLESEAFEFAENLLLPSHLLIPILEKQRPDLNLFKEIAVKAEMSFSATANRCCDLLANLNTPSMLIKSKDNLCKYIRANKLAREWEDSLRINKGDSLPLCSPKKENYIDETQTIEASIWFDDSGTICKENLIQQTFYQENGYALTILIQLPKKNKNFKQ